MNSTEHPVKVGLSDAFMARVPSSPSSASGMNPVRLQSVDLQDLLGDPADPHLSVHLSLEKKRQTIYEYHRVEVDASRIVSRSALVFTPLPSKYLLMWPSTAAAAAAELLWFLLVPSACLQLTSCLLCLTSDLAAGCGWCNTLQR